MRKRGFDHAATAETLCAALVALPAFQEFRRAQSDAYGAEAEHAHVVALCRSVAEQKAALARRRALDAEAARAWAAVVATPEYKAVHRAVQEVPEWERFIRTRFPELA